MSWGLNTVGQLGIASNRSNVVGIAAAGDYSLALLNLFISWPVTVSNYSLEGTGQLDMPFTVLNPPFETNVVSQTITAVLPLPAHPLFLRLRAR